MSSYLGIDTGGTFTDFVHIEGGNIRIHKVLSTPDSPEQAILQGITDLDISLDGLQIVHGTTVATNAVLESKGAKTAYITNKGFKDTLLIGRQTRQELYNLTPHKMSTLVDPDLCIEVDARISADGCILQELDNEQLLELKHKLEQIKPQAVAINFLFSFVNHAHETRIAETLPANIYISCSHKVLAEVKEFERGIATWLNAYVGPLVKHYLNRLEKQLRPATISVMRSSGQTASVKQAANEAVQLLLSGPAGGLSAARMIASLTNQQQLLTFDMGGTSTDVALYNTELKLDQSGRIAGFPVSVPMVDIHTIGAGGGSEAWIDAGNALHVGPQSAGADPGPVCYQQGGDRITVTDANLVLGYLPSTVKLGGTMGLDLVAARQAMHDLVNRSGIDSVESVANGIIRIVNDAMAQALRVISVERGIDPRHYALLAFGGAGGLHICALADELNMHKAIVPVHSGVLSALGMLAAPVGRTFSQTIAVPFSDVDDAGVNSLFRDLLQQAENSLLGEGVDIQSLDTSFSMEVRYLGQSSSLNIAWSNLEQARKQFEDIYQDRYGQLLPVQLELLAIRLKANTSVPKPELSNYKQQTDIDLCYQNVHGVPEPVPIIKRFSLEPDKMIPGPAIIIDEASTVWLEAGWSGKTDPIGNLLLTRD